MRIQHNISALNSWGRLGVNQNNAAKNLEKLSSGYRINRAGDDAAGLAISEKMRGQIRGLDMASKNAQDGISLIQTAEGALDETHSILQRMRELAVQSANGTYQDEDRANTDLEIQALKSELDRISSSTHFNKIQLLDGSLGGGSSVKSVNGTDASNSITSANPVAGGANATPLGETGAGTTVKFTAGKDAVYNADGLKGSAAGTAFSYIDDKQKTVTGTGLKGSVSLGTDASSNPTVEFGFTAASGVSGAFTVGDSITINGKTITFDTVKDVKAAIATAANSTTDIAEILNSDENARTMTLSNGEKITGEWSGASGKLTWKAEKQQQDLVADKGITDMPQIVSNVKDAAAGKGSKISFDVDFSDNIGKNFKVGEKLNFNGVTITFVSQSTTGSSNTITGAKAVNVEVGATLAETLDNIAKTFNMSSTNFAGATIDIDGGTTTVQGTWSAEGSKLSWVSNSTVSLAGGTDLLSKITGLAGTYEAGNKIEQTDFVIKADAYTKAPATKATGQEARLDMLNAKAGDTIQIGNRTFELVEQGNKASKGNIAVTIDNTITNEGLATARNLRDAINNADIDGVKGAYVEQSEVKIVSEDSGKNAKLPDINVGTIYAATSGITTMTIDGVDHNKGGNFSYRGFKFDDITGGTAGTKAAFSIKLMGDTAAAETTVEVPTGSSSADVMQAIMDKINDTTSNNLWRDEDGNNLYTAYIDSDSKGLVIQSTKMNQKYAIRPDAITLSDANGTNAKAPITNDEEFNYQNGKLHSEGGSGATTILDFSNAGVGDTFRINGKDYELVASKDSKPLTSGANAIVFNTDTAAMVKDIAKVVDETGGKNKFNDNGYTYDISADGAKLSLVNEAISSKADAAAVAVGSVGTNATVDVAGLTLDFGKSNMFNDYSINVTKDNTEGAVTSAAIDADNKTLNINVGEDTSAAAIQTAIRKAMKESGNPEMVKLADEVKVDGDLADEIGTAASNATTEITFKSNMKAGDTIKIGDTTYQVGKAGDTAKGDNVLLEVTPDAGGNFTGAAVAEALAKIQSPDFTITADGNKAIITANGQEAIAATVSDSNALVFQIGANGSADQRVSMNIDDMSAKGIGVDAIDITNVDAANSAIDVIDNAINTVSATRANLGAMQNRLEHTINSLNTTSENLTAAESRIRDVDMAKEMMAFTKNNILTQAAQAMLAQANQQPQGVLQLLQ